MSIDNGEMDSGVVKAWTLRLSGKYLPRPVNIDHVDFVNKESHREVTKNWKALTNQFVKHRCKQHLEACAAVPPE